MKTMAAGGRRPRGKPEQTISADPELAARRGAPEEASGEAPAKLLQREK